MQTVQLAIEVVCLGRLNLPASNSTKERGN